MKETGELGAFTAVMATGIVSVALFRDGHADVSDALFVVAVAVGCALVVLASRRARRVRVTGGLALAPVAAVCVVGDRALLAGTSAVSLALLAAAAVAWAVLLGGLGRCRARLGSRGSELLLVVSTQGLATLAAALAAARGERVLAWIGLGLWAAGIVAYAAIAPGVLRRLARDPASLRGDDWVGPGALAISSVAASALHAALPDEPWTGYAAAALLGLELAWVPLLVRGELRARLVRYHPSRWSTVFPLGMTALACERVAGIFELPSLRLTGGTLAWIAVAAWLLVALGFVHGARSEAPS